MAIRNRTLQAMPNVVRGDPIYENADFLVGLSSTPFRISPGQLAVVFKDTFRMSEGTDVFAELIKLSSKAVSLAIRAFNADGANIIVAVSNAEEQGLHATIAPRYASLNETGIPMEIVKGAATTRLGTQEAEELRSRLPPFQSFVPGEARHPGSIGTDVFCRVVRRSDDDIAMKISSRMGSVIVVPDATPTSFGHALVMSYDHYAGVTNAPPALTGELGAACLAIAKKQLAGLDNGSETITAGISFITINTGPAAGQTVGHLHAHVRSNVSFDGVAVRIDLNGPRQGNRLTSEEMRLAVTALRGA